MYEYTVQEGDTLTKLSAMFFGNTSDYVKIYYANPQIKDRTNGLISDENYIRAGEVLRIPVYISAQSKPKTREELSDKLRIFADGQDLEVSNFSFSSAFDAVSNTFNFEYSLFESGKIKPLGYEKITVEIGEFNIMDGIIYDISTNGNTLKCSGKSITSLIENTCISGGDVGFSFADTSLRVIANRFTNQYGINVIADSSAASLANKPIPIAEISETDTISSIISKLAQDLGLYLCCDNKNNLILRKLNYVGSNIFTIENGDFPLNDLSVEYKGSALFSIYSLYSGGDENGNAVTQNRQLSICKAHRIKRIKQDKKDGKDDKLNLEISKNLIACCKVSFKLPFVMIKNKLIECGQTFDLVAPQFFINQKTRFLIESVQYNFSSSGASCSISACLASAVESH